MIDKQHENRWLWYVFAPVLVLIGFLTLGFQTSTVEATSAVNAPKVSIVSDDPDSKMAAQYSFVPEFDASGKTSVITSNISGWSTKNYISSVGLGNFNVKSLYLGGPYNNYTNYNNRTREMKAGNIWAKYTNIGRINGRSVDIKVTVTDWSRYLNANQGPGYMGLGYLSFRMDKIGFVTQGMRYTDLQWTIHDSRTGKLVKNVSGYYTFNDIDFEQGVGFPESTWKNNIDHVLLEERNNRLSYRGPKYATAYENRHDSSGFGTHDFVYDQSPRIDANDDIYDQRHSVTILYSDTDALNIRWSVDSTKRQDFKSNYKPGTFLYASNNPVGDLLMYTTIKPSPTMIPHPKKVVSHNGPGGRVTDDTVFKYKVTQRIPLEHRMYYYKTFEMRDSLDSVFDIQSVRVLDMDGTDVTRRFNISTKNNDVKATIKSGETKKTRFYNNEYRLEIDAKINGNKVVSKFGKNSYYDIKNTAKSVIDGTDYPSNTTTTRAYRRQLTVNHVRDRGGEVAPTEQFNYLEGMDYAVSPKTNVKNSRGHLYRHIKTTGDAPKGTISSRNHSVTFIYDEPREITVEHRTNPRVPSDKGTINKPETGELLGSDTIWEYDGGEVTGESKSHHFKDDEGYFYRPRTDYRTITVKGEGTIILPYDIPRTITIHHDDKDPKDQIQSPNVKRLRTTFVKQTYDDERYTIKPFTDTLTDSDGYYFRPVDPSDRTGRVLGDVSMVIEYERPRIIRLAHYDKDSNEHLRTDTHSARAYDKNSRYYNSSGVDTASRYTVYSYKDEELSYHHDANDEDYFYYVPSSDRYAGDEYGRARQVGSVRDVESRLKIKDNTYTLDFYYTKPALDIGLNYIRIDTGRLSDGLPILLEFDMYKIVDDRWSEEKAVLTIYDRSADNKKVYQKDIDVKKIADSTSNKVERTGGRVEIDASDIKEGISHMDKGAGHVFEAVVSTKNKMKLVPGVATHASIDTNAYTASERVIRGNSVEGESQTFEYKGVAMTERKQGDDVDEHFESSFVTIDPSISLLSGYGYESQQHVEFQTDVPDHKFHRMNDLAKIKGYASVHANIADGNYTYNDGRYEFNLENPGGYDDGSRSRKVDFVMPEVYVNRKDGSITTTENDKTVTGGRKVYIPIWTNSLGTFDYNVKTNRMGRNYVMYDLKQDVTVEAYMFGHIDSETLSDDALMIEPAKTGLLDKWFGKD